jgi:DNA mismatch repair protein MutS
MRRQTLVNAERFYTPELKEHENRVLNARERIEKLEMELYREICKQLMLSAGIITSTARTLAILDVLTSLAEVAARYNYICPELIEGDILEIIDGRHPVVEQNIPPGTFVPNNTDMSCDKTQVMLLTGPNMAGKSTYIRQVAILVLMAQIGSFIPAAKARIGIVDRIFTRVGLQDDLSAGQSTFMVEMLETASILNHATPSSLVVLDEIGRGTSTYDGLSIARAVAEYLHDSPNLRCRTLFATHFHELTELADRLDRVSNYNVAVSDENGDIIFLHRILPGGADKSYGVHVAKLAGLPPPVIRRASEILDELEAPIAVADNKKNTKSSNGSKSRDAQITSQLSLFPNVRSNSKALSKLSELKVEIMTPIEAISMLHELQNIAEQENGTNH